MFVLRFVVLAFLAAYSIGMGSIPSDELNAFGHLVVFSGLVTVPLLYMLPTIEAKLRGHTNIASIALVNFFLGWTLLGWVVALVWAFKLPETNSASAPPQPASDPVTQPDVNTQTKTCPFCAEDVKFEAIKCKHCGSELAAS
ncbi:superinfection immunity protein [Pseudomonas mosselii]|uniref:superinfection immunity protein n=1 Tax=Pseudomonas mosselii TaxID=78327 RepID=UPI0020C7EE05|nr:superinfection immunity protein [Pseudomonas mosselii]